MSTDEFNTEMELYGVSPGVIAFIMFPLTLVNIAFSFFPNLLNVPFATWYIISMIPLNILFAIWIVRYYQAKSSEDSVLMIGILSVMLPTVIHLLIANLFGVIALILPFPLQFIAGLVILRKFDGPEAISPWSGMRLDLSWWKWKNPKKKSDWDPVREEKKSLETEEWLEE